MRLSKRIHRFLLLFWFSKHTLIGMFKLKLGYFYVWRDTPTDVLILLKLTKAEIDQKSIKTDDFDNLIYSSAGEELKLRRYRNYKRGINNEQTNKTNNYR